MYLSISSKHAANRHAFRSPRTPNVSPGLLRLPISFVSKTSDGRLSITNACIDLPDWTTAANLCCPSINISPLRQIVSPLTFHFPLDISFASVSTCKRLTGRLPVFFSSSIFLAHSGVIVLSSAFICILYLLFRQRKRPLPVPPKCGILCRRFSPAVSSCLAARKCLKVFA